MVASNRDPIASEGCGVRAGPAGTIVSSRVGAAATSWRPTTRRVLRVLVVDDDHDAADSLCTLLRLWGHGNRVAYSGAAALVTAAAYRPDALLLDLAMPGMNGLWLARRLRRHPSLQGLLLIAITGYGDDAHRQLGMEAGFDHFLVKPVDPVALEDLLRHEGERRAEDPTAAAAPPARARGILVVDDEACVRGVLGAALRQRGFIVWLAADGLEAVELFDRHREAIDVIVLDVRMPGPDGPQTLGALRQLNATVPCCFMSGEPGRHTAQSLQDLGAAAVFAKPFPVVETAQTLWELAGRSATAASGPPHDVCTTPPRAGPLAGPDPIVVGPREHEPQTPESDKD